MALAQKRSSRKIGAEILQRGGSYRIAVSSRIEDARAQSILHSIRSRFPKCGVLSAALTQCYSTDARLSEKDLRLIAKALTNPLIEKSSTGDVLGPQEFQYVIEIGFLPGVTDNVGGTARQTAEDCLGRKFKESEKIYSSKWIFLAGEVSRHEAGKIANEFYNPLIERVKIFSQEETRSGIPIAIPKVSIIEHNKADEVGLNVSDAELEKISKEGIEGGGPLALSLAAMKVIRDHFAQLGRNPTDVELESLAQTWSEHCKHTIFADPLDEVKEGIYRRYIKGATEKIRKGKGGKDFCVSVFKDNSGAIEFDKDYLITHKVETHNSPSALDPFGGAVTGIVGVNRDALGFGLGAKPLANTYGFCVAEPSDGVELFRDAGERQPLLSSRRILEGIVAGVNAGGNQSGIPTSLGFVAVDPSYRGKPLVFCGTVGLIPKKLHGNPSTGLKARKLYEKRARPGDYIVMIGGRVGQDGIHGATFSSESLSKGSPATSVQIGDPITQKKLSGGLIREARGKDLYSSITDNGAGGLSGSVGEMAKESGGCEVDLAKVPLKYQGLAPWQIWLSESQERMTLAVPKKKWPALKKIFGRHDVEATRIGVFTDSGRCIVRYGRKKVMDVSMEFLHDGRPIQQQSSKRSPDYGLRKSAGLTKSGHDFPIEKAILDILARPNIASTSFISEQYDHEVQGTSITKPLQGKGRVNADSAVLQPLQDSPRGIVLAHGYCPWYSAIDTYAMAAASIDTAVRNAVCAGAKLDYLAILDNFCWSSSEKPERLYELKEAARACYDTAVAYGTPFISGKDSMFNDFRGYTAKGEPIHIAALPTLLISALGIIPDVAKAMTIDFKQAGDPIYLVGETNDELGETEYLDMLGLRKSNGLTKSANIPVVDTGRNKKTYTVASEIIQKGFAASAIGVGRGGLAAALAKSAIAGQLGANIDLKNLPGNAKLGDAILFSESQGRILISVRKGKEAEFEKITRGLPCAKIGTTTANPSLALTIGGQYSDISLHSLTESYRSFFKNW